MFLLFNIRMDFMQSSIIIAHIKAQSQNMRIYLSLLSMLIPDLSGLRMLSSKIVFY